MMFDGAIVALVTPFRDGKVDEKALSDLIERCLADGASGFVPCGSTGESATLSHDEHRQVVEVTVKATAGRKPVIAGTGSNNTQEAVALTRHAKAVGADGALLISPYYNKPTQEGIYLHYKTVAEAAELPIIVYNIPGRTASNILPGTLARLSKIENIVGVKEASGNLHQIAEVARLCGPSFEVISGDDALTLPILAVGGCGVITAGGNVIPGDMAALCSAGVAGDAPRARAVHQKMLPLLDALGLETNPIAVKAALALQGRVANEVRLPLTPLTPANTEKLRLAMKDYGLL
ncbi:MAG: 4-hydroxy-tetrahydrodipicolinate synthase [Myxococcota bacterium]